MRLVVLTALSAVKLSSPEPKDPELLIVQQQVVVNKPKYHQPN
jgi:hypothetical protein